MSEDSLKKGFKMSGFKNLFAAVAAFLIVASIPVTIFIGSQINDFRGRAAGTGAFEVVGNKIIDPAGNQFIVKGMTPIYGPFAGGDDTGSWSTYSLNNATSIFNDLKNNWSGVNLVRIFTSGAGANGTGPADWNLPNYRPLLWDVVQKARNAGFVVLLVNSYSNITDTRSWIKELALKYKDDPYVWITPSNEPFCTSPSTTEKNNCNGGSGEWQYWRTNMNTFIADIRSQGFHNPILINSIQWSWDLSQIGTYSLTDPDNKLIYGSHRYANDNTAFNSSEQSNTNSSWANLSTTYPIVADEIGNCNGGLTQFTWLQGMTDFITNWVNTRQGSGMIAFNHYWSDCNTQTTNGVTRNSWGNYYLNNYLAKVNGTVGTNPTPTTGIPSPIPTTIATPTTAPGTITPTPTRTPTPTPTRTPTPVPGTPTPTLTAGQINATITVTDAVTNNPISGATVVFNNVSKTTSTNGEAVFSVVSGSYPLTVSKNGYTTFSWPSNPVTTAWPFVSVALNPTGTGPTPTPTTALCLKTGDLNCDNQIGILDLSILLTNWNTTNAIADINRDGNVTILDLSILLSNWGK